MSDDTHPLAKPHQHSALVVEDDSLTRGVLVACLKDAGMMVAAVANIAAAHSEIGRHCPDLVVLDLGLPDGDGITLAREIRATHAATGILIVTSRIDAMNVVMGLEIGADDYVRKPFIPREVTARAQAILRRLHDPEPGDPWQGGGQKIGRWHLDTQGQRLVDEEGHEVDLTRAEFDLLAHLVRSSGRVQSREQLLRAINSQTDYNTDRTVDVLIGRLRRKLDDDGFNQPELIQTVRGIGYRFVPAHAPSVLPSS